MESNMLTAEAYSSIYQHLENMINYNDFQSNALSLFKTNISYLSKQLFLTISPNTHVERCEKWYNALVDQQKILGYPEYEEGDPYGGKGNLVNTPENRMRKYINYEIDAIYTILFVRSVKNTQSCVSNQYFVQTTRQRHT